MVCKFYLNQLHVSLQKIFMSDQQQKIKRWDILTYLHELCHLYR